MKDKYPKYLPIGSVVILNGGKKRLMITGYAQVDLQKANKVYDYCGCLYPEGIISTDNNMLFNHDDIAKIFCIGYSDDEQKEWSKKLLTELTPEKVTILLKEAQAKNPESL